MNAKLTRILLVSGNAAGRLIIGFIALKIIAVYGNPKDIIYYAQIQSTLNVLITISQLGIGYGLITILTELQSYKLKLDYFHKILLMYLLSIALITILVYMIGELFNLQSIFLIDIKILTIAICGGVLLPLLSAFHVSNDDSNFSNKIYIVTYMIAFVLMLFFKNHDIKMISFSVLISSLVTFLFSYLLIFIHNKNLISIKFRDLKFVKEFIRKNFLFSIYTGLTVIIAQSWLIFSRYFISIDSQDVITASWQGVVSLMSAATALFTIYFSTVFVNRYTSSANKTKFLWSLFLSITFFYLCILISFLSFGDLILQLILNKNYGFNKLFALVIVKEYLVTLTMAICFIFILKREVFSLIKLELIALLLYVLGVAIMPYSQNLMKVLSASLFASLGSFIYALAKLKVILK